jgi:hypothetical protein
MILVEVALSESLPPIIQMSCLLIAAVTAMMQLLQIWTEKPIPGKDCQGRDFVE